MDDIRPPDKSINEQLIEDTRSDFEKEIDEALYISMLEVKKQQDKEKENIFKKLLEQENTIKDKDEQIKTLIGKINFLEE